MQVDLALLVDDNDVDLFIQKRFIEISGFAKAIQTYNSPTQAIRFLQESSARPPQIIFLDLNMPDMDGFGFLEKLLELPAKIQQVIRVIVLTSSNNQADRQRAKSYSSVASFISKPLSVEALQVLRAQMAELN